jgi:hypothetical protein
MTGAPRQRKSARARTPPCRKSAAGIGHSSSTRMYGGEQRTVAGQHAVDDAADAVRHGVEQVDFAGGDVARQSPTGLRRQRATVRQPTCELPGRAGQELKERQAPPRGGTSSTSSAISAEGSAAHDETTMPSFSCLRSRSTPQLLSIKRRRRHRSGVIAALQTPLPPRFAAALTPRSLHRTPR